MSTRYDHYKVLGVERHANLSEIKRAYRDLVKQCHPDRNPSPRSAAIFQAVHEAYSILTDPTRRQRHDALLELRDLRTRSTVKNRPATPRKAGTDELHTKHWAFVGLHLTGLLFGISMLASVTVGTVYLGWPSYVMFLSIPGLLVIPDSWEGLRMK